MQTPVKVPGDVQSAVGLAFALVFAMGNAWQEEMQGSMNKLGAKVEQRMDRLEAKVDKVLVAMVSQSVGRAAPP